MSKIQMLVAYILLFAIAVSARELEYSHYVSKQHTLFAVEHKAIRKTLKNPQDYERFAVDPTEGTEETYRKLILLNKCKFLVGTNPRHTKKFGTLIRFMLEQREIAHNSYPESAIIAIKFASYNFFHGGDDAPLVELVSIINPYLPEIDRVPAMPRMLATIFDTFAGYKSFKDHHESRLAQILDLTPDDPEPKEILELLATYWAAKIDPSYSVKWTEEMVFEAREKLTEENRRLALRAWRQLIEAHYEVSRPRIKAEIIRERQERNRERLRQLTEERERAFFDLLSELENGIKTDAELRKIMRKLSSKAYSEKLEVERLPNYEAIKAKLGEYEAETANAFFILHVHNDLGKAGRRAGQLLKQNPEDIRLLSLKGLYEAEEGNLQEAREIVQKMLEIDSSNRMATGILLHIKCRAENDQPENE